MVVISDGGTDQRWGGEWHEWTEDWCCCQRLKCPEVPGLGSHVPWEDTYGVLAREGRAVATDPLCTNDGEVARPFHLHPGNCNDVPSLAPQLAA